ncbi:hypothetical protein CO058_00620 [candidate division WWE3 bacterium CG_4_9_14_0_2_um_filter_35_11]|uniref:Glycosyltransferase RgtA/B/C/D-like domain-containing protein n=1 Tax=candidate division WWE3 bacterium CG_4_9_14_0_2_um_filter_35_11 TaxID=1975077 RepID=A0A2M8EMM2_UNCKA|nr:MAG: hypothetical protein COV25_01440 [candidate division WWE3 bacterium CG10_big_fil_rev_8_21_14_0_10_35_32]PJC23980.1 MAG: hypothetical protein CO058_00620 [candidate division WWE3 bacterium CG_4_9_14_0_2_um_filter_35_11]
MFFTLKIPTHPISDNDASRLAGTMSIVQYSKLNIDDTPYKGIGDRVVYNGKSYSSKPPFLNFVTGYFIKFVFQLKPALLQNQVAIYKLSAFLTNVIPILIIFIASRKILNLKHSLFLIFGTLIFSYSKFLTNHILEAAIHLLLFCFLIQKKQNVTTSLATGVLLSLILAIDITGGAIVIPVTLCWYIFVHKDDLNIKNLLLIFISSLPITILHFALNYIQFETFLPPQLLPNIYLSYENSKWLYNKTGFELLDDPILIRFFNYTFGTYGLFLYQPILLFSLFVKRFDKRWLFIIAITLGYILFNTIMQKNYGGSAFGPRRFLPLIPLLYILSIENINILLARSKILIILIGFIYSITVLISIIGYQNPWNNYDCEINGYSKYFPLICTIKHSFFLN